MQDRVRVGLAPEIARHFDGHRMHRIGFGMRDPAGILVVERTIGVMLAGVARAEIDAEQVNVAERQHEIRA